MPCGLPPIRGQPLAVLVHVVERGTPVPCVAEDFIRRALNEVTERVDSSQQRLPATTQEGGETRHGRIHLPCPVHLDSRPRLLKRNLVSVQPGRSSPESRTNTCADQSTDTRCEERADGRTASRTASRTTERRSLVTPTLLVVLLLLRNITREVLLGQPPFVLPVRLLPILLNRLRHAARVTRLPSERPSLILWRHRQLNHHLIRSSLTVLIVDVPRSGSVLKDVPELLILHILSDDARVIASPIQVRLLPRSNLFNLLEHLLVERRVPRISLRPRLSSSLPLRETCLIDATCAARQKVSALCARRSSGTSWACPIGCTRIS